MIFFHSIDHHNPLDTNKKESVDEHCIFHHFYMGCFDKSLNERKKNVKTRVISVTVFKAIVYEFFSVISSFYVFE